MSYATKLSTLLIAEQPDAGALQYGSPRSFSASSDGNSSGSTVISTALAGAGSGNDSFVGDIVECVSATNTENQHLRRRIVAYDDSTGTITVDRFPSQVKSGDTFHLLVPPHPIAVEDTGGATDNITDSLRDEADDYWNTNSEQGGPYLEVIEADSISKSSLLTITDFAQATGKLSVDLGATNAVGDYCEIWRCPEVMSCSPLETSQEDIERDSCTGSFDSLPNIKGNRGADGTIELAFRGPGTGNEGEPTEISPFLRCGWDESASNDDLTCDSGSTTTSVEYSAGTPVKGALYLSESGSVALATDAGSPVAVTPALDSAPQSGETFRALTTYTPSDDVNHHLAVKQYLSNSIIEYIWGAYPKLKFSAERGSFLKVSAALTGLDYMTLTSDSGGAISRAWNARRTSVNPVKVGSARCSIGGTQYAVKSFSLDPGEQVSAKENINAPNEVDGYCKTGMTPTGEIVVVLNSSNRSQIDAFLAGKEMSLLIQVGSRAGYPGVFAVYCDSIQYTGAKVADASGRLELTLPFKVNRSRTSGLPTLAIGVG